MVFLTSSFALKRCGKNTGCGSEQRFIGDAESGLSNHIRLGAAALVLPSRMKAEAIASLLQALQKQ